MIRRLLCAILGHSPIPIIASLYRAIGLTRCRRCGLWLRESLDRRNRLVLGRWQ